MRQGWRVLFLSLGDVARLSPAGYCAGRFRPQCPALGGLCRVPVCISLTSTGHIPGMSLFRSEGRSALYNTLGIACSMHLHKRFVTCRSANK